MADNAQDKREMRIKTPLGKDALLLTAWEGHEALSELFHFQAALLGDLQKPIAFDALLGHDVTVTLEQGDGATRYFHGMVRAFRQGRRDDSFMHYEAEIVPRLWLSTKCVQSRIFQQQTVPEILAVLFAGVNVSFELSATYEARNYCVQYRESDFDFASRLMEEDGIFYFFKHSDGQHQMVVTDSAISLPTIAGPTSIIYDELQGGLREEARITRWDKEQHICASKFTVWDHCFELPGQNLEATSGLQQTVQVGKVTHSLNCPDDTREIYDYPGDYAKRYDGVGPGGSDRASDLSNIFQENQRTASTRMQQEAAGAVQCSGDSTCTHFSAGHRFSLARHFNGDGPYLLARVEHSARLPAGYRSGDDAEGLEYENHFVCLPSALTYRPPRRTKRPTINGSQTAVVVGPEGQEVFCDKYGRIKVQFHWDRQGQHNAKSSCWLRVAQLWAGNRWGAFFWPRIGQEVVVDFLEGDPDRPLIVGCVYNAQNMPPFEMPQHAMTNGIKSCSVTGDASSNFNGVVFYDSKGQEYVQVHSERHEKHNAETSRRVQVGQTHTKIVGGLSMSSSGSGGDASTPATACPIPAPHFAPSRNKQRPTPPLSARAAGLLHDPAVPQQVRDAVIEHIGSGRGGEEESPPFSWKGTDVMGSWAKDLDLTVGEKVESLLGIGTDICVGAKIDTVINPLGFVGQLGGGASPVALGLSGAFGGTVDFVIGSETYLIYGPHIDIHHGAKLEYNHGITLTLVPALAVAALELATSIVAGVMPDESDEIIAEFCGTAVTGIAMSILIAYESSLGLAAMAEEAAEHAEMAATVATLTEDVSLLQPAVAAAGLLVEDAAEIARGVGRTLNDRINIIDGRHVISGQSVIVRASPPADSDATPMASIVALSPTQSGMALLRGGSSATMLGGTAFVSCTKEGVLGKVNVNSQAGGTITLQQGIIPLAPRITLNDLGIKLSVGTSSISLSAETGITLQFGEFSIRINEAGIEMSVAESSLEITEAMVCADSGATGWDISAAGFAVDGPTIDLGCDAMYSLECAVLMESVDGAVERTAGVAMVE